MTPQDIAFGIRLCRERGLTDTEIGLRVGMTADAVKAAVLEAQKLGPLIPFSIAHPVAERVSKEIMIEAAPRANCRILTSDDYQSIIQMHWQGKSDLEIAQAVGKNARLVGKALRECGIRKGVA